MPESFVHLHVHSAYSMAEGAIKADKLPALARKDGMPALALTDTANLFGALEFSGYATKEGVQPILGCQLWLKRDNDERDPIKRVPDPVVALAMDARGLDNVQRLSSLGFLDSEASNKPAITLDQLRAHEAGVTLLTGGTHGAVGQLLLESRKPAAESLMASLREAFGDRLAVELHRHGTDDDRHAEHGLLTLAEAMSLPIVAANDVYFATAAMHEAHDALLCIAEGRTIAMPDRRRVTPEHWFKPAKAMRALFADLPDAADNTLAIARRCAIMAEKRKPVLPLCPKVRPGMTEADTVREMAVEGLERRLNAQNTPQSDRLTYRDRLAFELSVIEGMGFAGYFLIVADFIQWAKAHDIPVGPGRGSGAGSVAAWALTITDLDPLRFGLLFERFLNPDRVSMPDFDIDFCQDRRDEVIQYVVREYGADRVAQIITFGRLQAKAVVRDVGRVMGLPYGQVNKIAELIPFNAAKPPTLQEALDSEPRLREMRAEENVDRLIGTALHLEGLYRNASTHAAGVVIGREPLIGTVPLYRDPRSEMLVTQYSMKYVEDASLVKFDFLGLKTLTVLQRATAILKSQGITLDLTTIPLDDAGTFAMLAKGDAAGVFQFEGQGMRDCLRMMRPDRFEDLIAAVSLYRPGPMANIPAYCSRKHGEPWEAVHPSMRPYVEETYGILVYQEQVMTIAQELAGYTLGAADLLRRAMGKKIRSEMEAQRATFVDGAIAKGMPKDKAGEIFDLMARFAEYGFNKSHAAAYALISYQTAWLKANHSVAFLAASMSADLSNTDKLASHMQEASRLGVKILTPDVNLSEAEFSVERGEDGTEAIRFALAAVKRVGLGAMQDLVRVRGDKPFKSLSDLADRADPKQLNKLQIENLARAGAFECLDPNRARVHDAAEAILRRAQAAAEDRSSDQIGLFGGVQETPPLRLRDMPDWPQLDRLSHEAEAIGFHLSAHPLDAYKEHLRKLGVVPIARVNERALAGVGRMKIAGTVIGAKERTTKTGSRMSWIRLSDASGSTEITCFSEVLGKCREMLTEGSAVLFTAEARADGEAVRLTAMDCEPLEKAANAVGQDLRVEIATPAALEPLRVLLEREGRGKGNVIVIPRTGPGQEVELALPGRWNVSPRLAQALKVVPGVEGVHAA